MCQIYSLQVECLVAAVSSYQQSQIIYNKFVAIVLKKRI